MKKTRDRLVSMAQLCAASLALELIVSCSPSLTPSNDRGVGSDESATPSIENGHAWSSEQEVEWQSRDDAISRELERPGSPPWAGTYYCGDGLGMNVTIRVAPDAGVTYTWTGCLGVYDLNYGAVSEVKSDRLIVDFVIDPMRSHPLHGDGIPRQFLSRELCFVEWGNRRYMIPSTQMFTFCNSVNDGSAVFGAFPLRVDSDAEKKRVQWLGMEPAITGPPVVPAEYRDHLLQRPITATIRAVLDRASVEPYVDKSPRERVRVSIDRGREHGVRVEMRMWAPGAYCIGRVVEVAATNSIVEFFRPSYSAGTPKPRDLVSTVRSPNLGDD